jgi:hypothetical protein
MNELLLAIVAYLSTTYGSEYFTTENVFIFDAGTVDLIPFDVPLPCIGVKDGPENFFYESVLEEQNICFTQIAFFVDPTVTNEALLGNSPLGRPGLLKLAHEARKALRNNDLGLSIIETALPVHATESELISDEKGTYAALRKILTMKYTMLEAT